jgi:hypothetical protein
VLACLLLSADFLIMVSISLVYSIHYSTEVAIQKMIEASQECWINGQEEGELGGLIPLPRIIYQIQKKHILITTL